MRVPLGGYGRYRIVGLLFVLISALASVEWVEAALARVTRIDTAETTQEIQVSIAASAPVRYTTREVQSTWIVVDLLGAELGIPSGVLPTRMGKESPVERVRVGQFQPDVVRVVIELARPMKFRIVPSADKSALLVRIPMEAAGPTPPKPSAPVQVQPDQNAAPQGSEATAPSAPAPARPAQKATPLGSEAASVRTVQAQVAPQQTWSIEPGRGIGPVRLGMRIEDVLAVLGQQVGEQSLPDGNTVYRWFEPPMNSGLGVRVTPGGVVFRIWVLNDTRFVTRENLHAGSTEAEVRAALGEPSQTVLKEDFGMKTLIYEPEGIWVSIQLDRRYAFYNAVFEIGVMEPKTASQAPN